MFTIEDCLHCESDMNFETFEEAIAELTRRAAVPWDQPPNVAPCASWKTCGRDYQVLEYDVSHTPWKLVRSVPVLSISAKGVEWTDGFKAVLQAFTAPADARLRRRG